MPKALETFHHALGTVVAGDDLPASHPIVRAVPHLFDATPDAPTEAAAPVKRGKAKG